MSSLSVIILTYNEAPNIGRTLGQLTWAERVAVLDSNSADITKEIVAGFPNTTFHTRAFDDHTSQWNFAKDELTHDSDWVLALDADYFITPELAKEIQVIINDDDPSKNAWWVNFDYAIEGKPVRSGIYPPVRILYRNEKARYIKDGHTQRIEVEGESGHLKNKAIHDDRKSFRHWINSQLNYATLEAEKLSQAPAASLSRQDRIRRGFIFTPLLVLFYCIFARFGWRDGILGWMYAFQRTIAEVLLQYKLLEKRILNTHTDN